MKNLVLILFSLCLFSCFGKDFKIVENKISFYNVG